MRYGFLTICLAILCGCASGHSGKVINDQYRAEIKQSEEYPLRAGDQISVIFNRNEEFSQQAVRVLDDGSISTGVGAFQLSGLTTDQAAALISRECVVVVNPDISVAVTETAPLRVYVGGEVGAVGMVDFFPNMTGLEAVLAAGGHKVTGKMRDVILIRYQGKEDRSVFRVNLKDLEKPLILLPNDIVYVPRTVIANINTFVDLYVRGILPINPSSLGGI